MIGTVVPESPAEKSGLKVGDQIKSIDGVQVKKFLGMGESVMWQILSTENDELEIIVDRDGKETSLNVEVPEPENPPVEGSLLKKTMAKLFARPPLPRIGIFPRKSAIIAEVSKNSPAAVAGLKKRTKSLSLKANGPLPTPFPIENGRRGKQSN